MARHDDTSRILLLRVEANDQEAWRRLLDLYAPLVVHWCRRRGAADHDLPDLVQEVFAAVGTGLKSFEKDRPGVSFRGWLRGIVRHKLADHYRRNAGQAEGGTEALLRLQNIVDHDGAEPAEHDAAIAGLYGRALDQVRAQFEARTWEAFWRVVMEDHSPAEVAAELGLTVNNVRQAKSRVLRRLKEELGELIA